MNISLIIPCYNEEANIQKGVLDKIGNFTGSDSRFCEVLLIDDGSTDNSRSIIKDRYLKQFPKFKLIENKHQGKAYAIIKGIGLSNGTYVMFSDIDLATPIEESGKLIAEIRKGYEVIIGSRNTTREGAPLIRKIQSLGFIYIRRFLIGLSIKDTQCGFKMFQKTAALKILDDMRLFKDNRHITGPSVSAAFDLEFLYIANKRKYKIKEVPVNWRHVETHHVTFVKDAIESIKDLVKIKLYTMTGKYN